MAQSSQDSLPTKARVIAAIPCFNNRPFVADVIARAKNHVDHVVVVDDGSVDGTAEAAREAGATVIRHAANGGYGEAMKSCFQAARASQADVLVVHDGDLQHDPDEIPRVLAPILSGEADMVIGSRFLARRTDMPRYRELGINVITFLYNFGAKVKISDAQSGFRAYSAKMIDALPLYAHGMEASVEILMKARERGFRIQEVPISCLYYAHGSSSNPVTHGLRVALAVIRLRTKSLLHRMATGKYNARYQGMRK